MMLMYMTLGGTLMFCTVLLARQFLQNRVHRSVWLILWALTALRLMLPLAPSSRFSVFNLPLFRQQTAAPEMSQTGILPVQSVPMQPVPAAQQTAQSVTIPPYVLIWICGAVAVFLVFAILHLYASRKYRFAMKIELPFDLPKHTQVKQMEGLSSPLTYGVFRPVILLPLEMAKDTERCERVIAHELSHIRHHDIAAKWFYLLVTAVHWFNPFAWFLYYYATQDMEMRADADAIKTLGGEHRAYAELLVEAEERKLRGYLTMGLSFSSTGKRLRAIVKGKASKAASTLTAVLLAAVLLTVCCTGQMKLTAQAAPIEQLPVLTPAVKMPSATRVFAEEKRQSSAPAETAVEEVVPVQEQPTEEQQIVDAPSEESSEDKISAETREISAQLQESLQNPPQMPFTTATMKVGEQKKLMIPYTFAFAGNPYISDPRIAHIDSWTYGGGFVSCNVRADCCGTTTLAFTTLSVYVVIQVIAPQAPTVQPAEAETTLTVDYETPDYVALIPDFPEDEKGDEP